MKIAYSYINIQDFPSAKKYLLDAKTLYTQMKATDDIKIIDSTLNKIAGLMG